MRVRGARDKRWNGGAALSASGIGSTYPKRSPARRTPRCRPFCWPATVPSLPISAPAAIDAPARTDTPATGMCVTRYGPQRNVTSPGRAVATTPAQAARTGAPGPPARSAPRCQPARNGSWPNANGPRHRARHRGEERRGPAAPFEPGRHGRPGLPPRPHSGRRARPSESLRPHSGRRARLSESLRPQSGRRARLSESLRPHSGRRARSGRPFRPNPSPRARPARSLRPDPGRRARPSRAPRRRRRR